MPKKPDILWLLAAAEAIISSAIINEKANRLKGYKVKDSEGSEPSILQPSNLFIFSGEVGPTADFWLKFSLLFAVPIMIVAAIQSVESEKD